MSDQSPADKQTQPEPDSTTSEKAPIRKSQEEFIGDEAQPSKERSEVAEGPTNEVNPEDK